MFAFELTCINMMNRHAVEVVHFQVILLTDDSIIRSFGRSRSHSANVCHQEIIVAQAVEEVHHLIDHRFVFELVSVMTLCVMVKIDFDQRCNNSSVSWCWDEFGAYSGQERGSMVEMKNEWRDVRREIWNVLMLQGKCALHYAQSAYT
jgi:hypothetical protein